MSTEDLDTILKSAAVILEGLAAVAAILFYRKYRHTALKYFPLILIYVFLNEVAADLIYNLGWKVVILYTLYNVIFFLFFYYVFWNFLTKKKNKRAIVASAIIYLISCLVNPFYQDIGSEAQLFSYIVGACLLILCIILYFIEILATSRVLLINQDLLFWISIGMLLFYVGYIPIKLTRSYVAGEDDVFVTLRIVHRILIIVMNGCFIFGFLWTKKK